MANQQIDPVTGQPGGHSHLWRGVRWGSALLLAGIAAWFSVRQISWTMLRAALAEPDLPLLVLALGTVLATTVAKAARWRILLQQCNARVSGRRVLRVLLIGQMGNSFLPARMGDVGRAVLVGPQAAGGIPAVVGTILVEKTLDGIMGLLVLLGLALWTPLPAWLRSPVLGLAALTGGLLVLLVLAAARQGWITLPAGRLIGWLPARVQVQAGRVLAGFRLGLGLFRQPGNALLALALSAVIWGLAALTNVAILAALDIDAPGWSTWLVLVTGYAANSLPALPAHVGVFEYACVLALTAVAVSAEPALAFGLVLHLVVYAPPAILGPVGMAIEGLNWNRLKKAQGKYLEDDGVAI